jgi:hypothetical protein
MNRQNKPHTNAPDGSAAAGIVARVKIICGRCEKPVSDEMPLLHDRSVDKDFCVPCVMEPRVVSGGTNKI